VDKLKPHYDLASVQALVMELGVLALTKTAIDGARALGLTSSEALAAVAGLSRRQFYKSMTTYGDARVWQDVYHAPLPDRRIAYVKLCLVADRPVIQFKEK
jgi:motility quorum-sensing regulator/GCU-specific mRNA interferase toxin